MLILSHNRKTSSRTNNELDKIEAEYIKNLQQQVYFLELEANYLYPYYMFNTESDNY